MRLKIPFTYPWLIKKFLDEVKVNTILDLGCGKGWLADSVNQDKKYRITGADIFEPDLRNCEEKKRYQKLIKKDLNKKLGFKIRSFDIITCLQTIEHLNRKRGEALLSEMEKIAKKAIIISTPVGECVQEEYGGSKHQHHLSSWMPEDFRQRGYMVYGIGLKFAYGSHSHAGKQMNLLKLPLFAFSFLMNPVAYKKAEIGCQMVAVKFIKKPRIPKAL